VAQKIEKLLDNAKNVSKHSYVVKIKLLESVLCFALSTNSAPCILANRNDSKELSIDIAIDKNFSEFLQVLLTEVNDGISITLSGRMDRVVFTAKNIGTKDVRYFLEIFCGGQPQIIPLYPVNNVSIERVLFEEY
jgi:hypothetical protein